MSGNLVPLNPQSLARHAQGTQEIAVSTYLEQAKSWLATAVERTGPEEIAAAKAQIATAAEATKQLNLSKEIQLDAAEMVRRAEYALGKAIRKGQADGTITTRRDGGPRGDYIRNGYPVHVDQLPDETKVSPSVFIPHGQEMKDVRDMTALDPGDFNAALAEAKAEGNVSRTNVVRKIKDKGTPGPMTREGRAALIAELADQGYSSRQMPAKVGVTEESVRQIARDFDIDIPADRSMRGTRRINSTSVATKTVTALEGLVMGIELIDYDEIDPQEASQWATSLTDSLRVLNRFAKQIKEMAQ